jgi:hypothetical protein
MLLGLVVALRRDGPASIEPVSPTSSIPAGSPALRAAPAPVGPARSISSGVTIVARVVDARTGSPVTATASIGASPPAQADADGAIRLPWTGEAGGAVRVAFAATGYDRRTREVKLERSASIDLGTVSLDPVSSLDVQWRPGSASGTVFIQAETPEDGAPRWSRVWQVRAEAGRLQASGLPLGPPALHAWTDASPPEVAPGRLISIARGENECALAFVAGARLRGQVRVTPPTETRTALPAHVTITATSASIAARRIDTADDGSFSTALPRLDAPMFVEASSDLLDPAYATLDPGWKDSAILVLDAAVRAKVIIDVTAIDPRPPEVRVGISGVPDVVWNPPVHVVPVDATGIATYRVEPGVDRSSGVMVAVAARGVGVQSFDGVDIAHAPARLRLVPQATHECRVSVVDAASWGPILWGLRAVRHVGSRITAAAEWSLSGCIERGTVVENQASFDEPPPGSYECWLQASTRSMLRAPLEMPGGCSAAGVRLPRPGSVVAARASDAEPVLRQILERYGDNVVLGEPLRAQAVDDAWIWEPLFPGDYVGLARDASERVNPGSVTVSASAASALDALVVRAGERTRWTTPPPLRTVAVSLAVNDVVPGTRFFVRSAGDPTLSYLAPATSLDVRVASTDRLRIYAEHPDLHVTPRLVALRLVTPQDRRVNVELDFASLRIRRAPTAISGLRLRPGSGHPLAGEEEAELFVQAPAGGDDWTSVQLPAGPWTIEGGTKELRDRYLSRGPVDLDVD